MLTPGHRYACNADDLVDDFVSLTPLVTKESLQALEASYNQSQDVPTGSFPQMQAAASRFLGRLWAGSSNSHNSVKSLNPNPSPTRTSTIRRSTSKQSMTSTLNSDESTSDASTAPTELSTATAGADGQKSRTKSTASSHHKDRDLHTQIEDLLMALTDLQRQHADLTRELQQEREEREEDQLLAKEMLNQLQQLATETPPADLISKAQARFATREPKRTSIVQTKHQLQDDVTRWKEMHEVESSRCLDLTRRMDNLEQEQASLKEQLREARERIQDGHRDRQRLERMNQELRAKSPALESETAPEVVCSDAGEVASPTGPRELKLVSTNSQRSPTSRTFSKRSSSLGLQNVLSTENHQPAPEEALLLELVNAKTAEAVAKQELEEVKAKLESLRKLISAPNSLDSNSKAENHHSYIGRSPSISKANTEPIKATASSSATSGGGFFSGWGRRAE